jgi:hypothetical protein
MRCVLSCTDLRTLQYCCFVIYLLMALAARPNARVCGLSVFWDCGFEPRRGHGCLSLVSVVCCQVEVSASGRSLVQRSPTECVYDFECCVVKP